MRVIVCLLTMVFFLNITKGQTKFYKNPSKVKIITSDVKRFWAMMEQLPNAATRADSIQLIQDKYLNKGSKGLKQLMQKKNYSFTAEDMYYTIIRYGLYLNSIKASSSRIDANREKILDSFKKLKTIYPAARFPDFYFGIGVFNTGGTGIPAGMFIGAEIETADSSSPLSTLPQYLQYGVKTVEKIDLICAHELIHFQQKDKVTNLLAASIHEGVCDFLGELISGGIINQYQMEYGIANEKTLWEAFKKDMNGNDYSNWLYNGSRAKIYPADMGYFIGYQICKRFYNQAQNKLEAIRELLSFTNAENILKKSGYDSCVANATQKITALAYDIRASINPVEKKIAFKTVLFFHTSNYLSDTIQFLLHKDSKITTVTINQIPAIFELQKSTQAANRFMPESRNLLIVAPRKIVGNISINIEYETDFHDLKQNNSHFTVEWISLASYACWYPYQDTWGAYTYNVQVSIPNNFSVSGTGDVSYEKGIWTLRSDQPVADMVLVASNQMQKRVFENEGTRIQLNYVAYNTSTADSIANGTQNAYLYFSALFGKIPAADLTIVATPQYGNSAFARRHFIYLQTKGQSSTSMLKTIGHEIAHFWWNRGADSWEDWLSESFAEFSTLLYLRQSLGEEVYQQYINQYREQTKGLEAIWGLNRAAKNASLILYYKGSVLLHDYMQYLGEERFLKLLASIYNQKIRQTTDLIQLVNTNISAAAADYLVTLLKQ